MRRTGTESLQSTHTYTQKYTHTQGHTHTGTHTLEYTHTRTQTHTECLCPSSTHTEILFPPYTTVFWPLKRLFSKCWEKPRSRLLLPLVSSSCNGMQLPALRGLAGDLWRELEDRQRIHSKRRLSICVVFWYRVTKLRSILGGLFIFQLLFSKRIYSSSSSIELSGSTVRQFKSIVFPGLLRKCCFRDILVF